MMKKMILLNFMLLIVAAKTQATNKIPFEIFMEDQKVNYMAEIPDFDSSIETPVKVFPKGAIRTLIHNKEILVFRADPVKSDTRGLFVMLKDESGSKILDYKFYEEYVLLFYFFLDIDQDGSEEIISAWGEDESYFIRVEKVSPNYEYKSMFQSPNLFNPQDSNSKKKLCIDHNQLLVFYSYNDGVVDKMAVITFNPDDRTHELFLKPWGICQREDWLNKQKQCQICY